MKEPKFTEIYQSKIDYYGTTQAALDFAADEYHKQMLAYENSINKLDRIIKHCKGEVLLHANPQTCGYQTIDQYLNDLRLIDVIDEEDFPLAEQVRISENGSLVVLTCYENSPIGSYTYYGVSVDEVVERALKQFKLF